MFIELIRLDESAFERSLSDPASNLPYNRADLIPISIKASFRCSYFERT